MTRSQKKVLKRRITSSLNIQKKQLKQLQVIGSRLHLRQNPMYKKVTGGIRKEIRFFRSWNKKLR